LTAILALLAGLAVFTTLIAWQGLDTVAATFGLAGWNPLWLAVYFFCLPIVLSTVSWRIFFAPRPNFLAGLHAMWIGLAVNWMLPVAQIGGEFVRARVIARRGVAPREAYASVLVDKTSQALTQLTYAVCGILIFAALYAVPDVTYAAAAFAVLLAVGIYTFYRVQQAGIFVAAVKLGAKLVGRFDWSRVADGAGNVDEAVRGIYARRADFWQGCAWRFAARVVAAGEVWLAFQFLDHPISVVDAVVIESIGQAVRGAAFIVPGALGVQEGGYMLLAAALGIGPDLGLALSLCKRVRELAIGIPGLIAWKLWEAQHLVRRRARTGGGA
jgi:putative membrane protein